MEEAAKIILDVLLMVAIIGLVYYILDHIAIYIAYRAARKIIRKNEARKDKLNEQYSRKHITWRIDSYRYTLRYIGDSIGLPPKGSQQVGEIHGGYVYFNEYNCVAVEDVTPLVFKLSEIYEN